MKCQVAVLVSGYGGNLQAILNASSRKNFPAQVCLVVSNQAEAYALKRAQKKKIPTVVISHKNISREDFEKELIGHLEEASIDLVVLAGFLRVLSPFFVGRYRNRIINIHPSLLPAFPGIHSIQRAWEYGARVTGVTVHFVDEGTDTGSVIFQESLKIGPKESLASLEKRIHRIEHRLLPEAICLFAEKKLEVLGRKVLIRSHRL